MKTIYTIILMTCFALAGYAQNPQSDWVKQIGGSNTEIAWSTMDADGYMYTAGFFGGIVDFDPGPGVENLTSTEIYGMFIQKLDTNGDLIWVKQIGDLDFPGGWNFFDIRLSITTDANGNIYTTGAFGGTVDFDPGPDVQNFTAIGVIDIFIQKLDADGNFLWIRQMGGANWECGNSIVADASGNVYTTGYFRGTADLDPGAGVQNFTAAGYGDIFIQKLDTDGNFLWAKHMGKTFNDEGTSIALDTDGNIYTTGFFGGTVDFDPGSDVQNFAAIGGKDIFVHKLDTAGNLKLLKE